MNSLLMWLKRILAFPGILLAVILLSLWLLIDGGALIIETLNVFYPLPVGFLLEIYDMLLLLSLILHVLLIYKNRLPIIPAWFHVLLCLSCLLFFYYSVGSPGAGTPRHYYDLSAVAMAKFIFFSMGNSTLVLTAKTFVLAQIVFWVYGTCVLVKGWKKCNSGVDSPST